MDNEVKTENNTVSEQKETTVSSDINQSSNNVVSESKPQETGNNNVPPTSGDTKAPTHNAEPISKQAQASDKQGDDKEKKHKLNKRQIIIISVIAFLILALIIGLVLGLNWNKWFNKVKSNFELNSETLTTETTEITLNEKVDVDLKVKDFYLNYGYTLPSTVDAVTINGKVLDSKNYNYSSGHLSIEGEFVTGKVIVTAEGNAVDFATDSWENVVKFANEGLNSVHIRYGVSSLVGFEHEIEVGNAKKKVRVIGEGHDRLVENGVATNKAATLTFELEDLIGESTYNVENLYVYGESKLKQYCDDTYDKFPNELKDAIQSVDKYTASKSNIPDRPRADDVVKSHSTEKLFPLSLREIGGHDLLVDNGQMNDTGSSYDLLYLSEESTYEYYQDTDLSSLNNKRNKGAKYWLRTPDKKEAGYTLIINEKGETSNGRGSAFNHFDQDGSIGVSVAFAIGKSESFITDSWENVASYSLAGVTKLQEHYGFKSFVGRERKIEMKMQSGSQFIDKSYPVRVIGERHDALANYPDKVAALTFEFVSGVIPTTFSNTIREPGESFTGSAIESYLNSTFYNSLPEEMRYAIPLVRKSTASYVKEGSIISEIEDTENYIFPLSLKEVGDIYYTLAEPYSLEEKTYDYYRVYVDEEDPMLAFNTLNQLRIKDDEYWLRTSYCRGEGYYVHKVGLIGNTFIGDFESPTTQHTHNTLKCAPAFSLGWDDKLVSFENDTWQNICQNAANGLDYLKEVYDMRSFIGATRDIVLNEGQDNEVTKRVRVIGQQADVTSEGETTTLTFEFTTPISKVRVSDDTEHAPIYSTSVIREYCNNEAFNSLPSVLKDYVKEVKKNTVVYQSENNYSIETTNDKLFPLSVNEINDDYSSYDPIQKDAYLGENKTYYYYTGIADFVRSKEGPTADKTYWLRSPSLTQGVGFYGTLNNYVNKEGYLIGEPATRPLGVAPAFAI